jgi:hypothetical protein
MPTSLGIGAPGFIHPWAELRRAGLHPGDDADRPSSSLGRHLGPANFIPRPEEIRFDIFYARPMRMTESTPAYQRLLQDYVDYHVVFLFVGGLFTALLLIFGVFCWIRVKRAGRGWSFEKKTFIFFGVASLLLGSAMAVVFAANVSVVVHPKPGLAWGIETLRAPHSRLSGAYHDWLQSGSADIPPLIQHKIHERLAWQQPKAIICTLLLIAFMALSVIIWRALINNKTGRRPVMVVSGIASAAACFLLMLMVIGNTESAIAPITMTYFYG